MKRYIIFALIALLGTSLLMANNLICGVGYGDSFDAAFADAQSKIAQQISVRVEAITELNTLDIEEDARHYYRESIEQNIKLSVDRWLNGVEIISQKEKKGKHEVKACIDKSKFLNALRGELDELKNAARNLVDGAEDFIRAGKPLFAIENYLNAQEYLPELYSKKAFYDSLSDSPYFLWHELNIGSIDGAIRELIGRVSFELASGGDQEAEQGLHLPNAILFKAYFEAKNGEKIPLPGYPITLTYGDGSHLESGQTDSLGYYKFSAIAQSLPGADKIIVSSSARDLPPHLGKLFRDRTAEVHYRVLESEKKEISLNIKGEKGNRDENLENTVIRALSGSAFHISEDAEYTLEGELIREGVKMVQSLSGSSYIATVRLELYLLRTGDGTRLGSFSAKGSANAESAQEAFSQAISKIKIDSRKLNASLQGYLKYE